MKISTRNPIAGRVMFTNLASAMILLHMNYHIWQGCNHLFLVNFHLFLKVSVQLCQFPCFLGEKSRVLSCFPGQNQICLQLFPIFRHMFPWFSHMFPYVPIFSHGFHICSHIFAIFSHGFPQLSMAKRRHARPVATWSTATAARWRCSVAWTKSARWTLEVKPPLNWG